MTRATERHVDYSVLDTTPQDVEDMRREDLEELHQAGIERELTIIRQNMQSAQRKRLRAPQKLCAISNNTNDTLAFEKGSALLRFLEENGLTQLYMAAEHYPVSGGHKDDWAARFDNPNGPGHFTIRYEEGYMEGELTHTQRLFFTARR